MEKLEEEQSPTWDRNSTGTLRESTNLDSQELSETESTTKEHTLAGLRLLAHINLCGSVYSGSPNNQSRGCCLKFLSVCEIHSTKGLPCLASVGENAPNLPEIHSTRVREYAQGLTISEEKGKGDNGMDSVRGHLERQHLGYKKINLDSEKIMIKYKHHKNVKKINQYLCSISYAINNYF